MAPAGQGMAPSGSLARYFPSRMVFLVSEATDHKLAHKQLSTLGLAALLISADTDRRRNSCRLEPEKCCKNFVKVHFIVTPTCASTYFL